MSAIRQPVRHAFRSNAGSLFQSRDRKGAVLQSNLVPSILKAVVGLAGAAGIAPAAASAQDCRLTVEAAPQVVYSGQAMRIHVYACPSDPKAPNAPYAFASAAFDVLAGDALWSHATDGVIVDSGGVLDIEVGQDHQPELGVYADPSNPLRIWGGVIKLTASDPMMYEIEANPSEFFVYPSQWTSSSVECEAEGGSDLIFMNPLTVGQWLTAPAPGTTIEIQDDVIIDGRIITGENYDSVSVGTVWNGSGALLDSFMTFGFDQPPSSFTATVALDEPSGEARKGQMQPYLEVKLTQTLVSSYQVGANASFSDGSVRPVGFDGFIGGVRVATGDLDDDGDNNIPGLVVDSLPQTVGAQVGPGVYKSVDSGLTWTLSYDQPIVATIRDANGLPQIVTLDRIEIYPTGDTTTGQPWSNDSVRWSLGSHLFEAEGVKEMWITPSQGG